MSEDLKIQKSEGMGELAIQLEETKLKQSISSIEQNIEEISTDYNEKMSELADEKNYTPFFYGAGTLVFILFLFKRTLSSFVLFIVFAGLFFFYKKFLDKEKRVIEIKEEFEPKLKTQKELLIQRNNELEDLESKKH